MTVYVKFVERGNATVGVNQKLVFIGNATTFLQIIGNASGATVGYIGQWNNGISSSVATAHTAAPNIGDIVEHRATLSAGGILTLEQTIAGVSTNTTPSAARTLPLAWGATTLWLNSFATANVGYVNLLAVCLVRGVQSLDTMRRYAGTHTRNG